MKFDNKINIHYNKLFILYSNQKMNNLNQYNEPENRKNQPTLEDYEQKINEILDKETFKKMIEGETYNIGEDVVRKNAALTLPFKNINNQWFQYREDSDVVYYYFWLNDKSNVKNKLINYDEGNITIKIDHGMVSVSIDGDNSPEDIKKLLAKSFFSLQENIKWLNPSITKIKETSNKRDELKWWMYVAQSSMEIKHTFEEPLSEIDQIRKNTEESIPLTEEEIKKLTQKTCSTIPENVIMVAVDQMRQYKFNKKKMNLLLKEISDKTTMSELMAKIEEIHSKE